MTEIEFDPELISDFIIESRELLDDFSANLIELENDPDDYNTINAIFRAAHTLKGSSAFFYLTHIKNFAHKLENLLDDLRNKRRPVVGETIDFLLNGGSMLKGMFGRLSDGDFSTDFTGEEEIFLANLTQYIEKTIESAPILTAEEALRSIAALTASYKKTPANPDNIIDQIEGVLTTIQGLSSQKEPEAEERPEAGKNIGHRYNGIDLPPLSEAVGILSKAVETDALDELAYDNALSELTALVDSQGLEALNAPLGEALEDFHAVRDSNIGFDTTLIGIMKEKLDQVAALTEKVTVEKEKEPDQKAAGKEEHRNHTPDEKYERKTMRIDEDKVDGFMNYVGELIVTSETFGYLQKMIEHEKVDPLTIRAFKNANQAFRELSGELQESLMEIRRVPIKGLLQKVNLMSRELSQQMGKKVKVEIEGQEVQLDKSIAENLEGPLVHIVRNSLDHGLESPAVRLGAGKSEQGTLLVRATADKEFFYLDISDDGHGIDPEKMRQTAVKKGMLSEAQATAMSDKDAVGLIFGAGFSTAREITDVSGRGVGMDVVRTNIQQLNGTVNIDSTIGQGTIITLKIPLSVTLQVIKALLVRVGKEHFIISLEDILESVRPSREDLSTVEGRGEIINRRGQILPLIRLYQVFDIEPIQSDPVQAILVIVETPRGRFALMVDEVLGQQQVVVKELDAQFKNLTFIAGSATLGDGRLGLVLNAEGVVQLAQR